MYVIFIAAAFLGAAPTEEQLFQGKDTAAWTYSDPDVTEMITLTLSPEKTAGGDRPKVILEYIAFFRLDIGERLVSRTWEGTYAISQGEQETKVECTFTKHSIAGSDLKPFPVKSFEPLKVTFHASEYGMSQLLPEMKLRYSADGRRELYNWKAGSQFLFRKYLK